MGKGIAEKYGARISHTYGTALNGYAVQVGEKQARRLAADSRVASVVQDTRVTLDHFEKNPPSWGWTGSTSPLCRSTRATRGRSRRARA